MPTKTAPEPPADLDAEVLTAKTAHAELLDRIDADEDITPLDLAESEATVRLAEERVALHARRAAAAAEERRLTRIRQIHASLSSDALGMAADVVAAYDETVAAGQKLHASAQALDAFLIAAWRELRQLGEIPPELNLEVSAVNGGFTQRITLDGRTLSTPRGRPAKLLGYACRDASPKDRRDTAEALTSSMNNPMDALRRLSDQ